MTYLMNDCILSGRHRLFWPTKIERTEILPEGKNLLVKIDDVQARKASLSC